MIVTALWVLLPATPMAAGTAAPAGNTTLGRLFMTPAERSALDAGRAGGDTAAATPQVVMAAPEQVLLNGVLIRSRGPDTVWINGEETRRGAPVRTAPAADHPVTVAYPGTGTTILLKPGQVWTPGSGRVTDCLGCQTAGQAGADAAAPEAGATVSSPEPPAAATPTEPAPPPGARP